MLIKIERELDINFQFSGSYIRKKEKKIYFQNIFYLTQHIQNYHFNIHSI